MRNLYTIFTILLFSAALSAQSVAEPAFKHTTTLGLSLGQSSLWADDDDRTSSLAIGTYATRRLHPNWQLGICLGYERVQSEKRGINFFANSPGSQGWGDLIDDLNYGNTYSNGSSSTSNLAGTYVQPSVCIFGRFIVNPQNRLSAFLQSAFTYGRGQIELDTPDTASSGFIANEFHTRSIDLGSRLGATYALNDHWGVTLLAGYLGYNSFSEKSENEDRFERTSDGTQTDVSLNSLRLAVEFSW